MDVLLGTPLPDPQGITSVMLYSYSKNHLFLYFYLFKMCAVVNGTHESARGTPVCPLGVLQSLRAAGWVVPADQQDAHELLHVLLSCIEEETTNMSKKV